MRKVIGKRNQSGFFTAAWKLGALALLVMSTLPGQALAAPAESCNGSLDLGIANQGPIFLGDTIRGEIELGAGEILGGSSQDITAFGFRLNCDEREDFNSCTDPGNTVVPPTEFETNCGVELNIAENLVQVVATPPINTLSGETCDVWFDFEVTGLAEGNTKREIIQAVGWPVGNLPATTCDNGLTSAASSTTSFYVQECGIELEKQVYDPELKDWVNADNADGTGAPDLLLGSDVEYRLVITNTGTVAYDGPVTVNDASLGIVNQTIPSIPSGGMVTVDQDTAGFGDLLALGHCSVEGTIPNEASVQAYCRDNINPVQDTASNKAHVNCIPPVYTPDVDIEKSTNGEDADTPTGPKIIVGQAVNWAYVVTNNGETVLTDIVVTDSMGESVDCKGKTTLAVDESMTCTATGTAEEGQYSNLGTVVAKSAGYSDVTHSDPSHYIGVTSTSIVVDKSIENVMVNEDGSIDVRYRSTVSNTGGQEATYDLEDTLMVDDALVPMSIVSGVDYVAGSEDDVGAGLNDSLEVADFDPAATLVEDETLAAGKSEAFDFTINFDIDGDLTTIEGTNCDPEDDEPPGTGLMNYVAVLVGGEVEDWDIACEPFELTPDIEVIKKISVDGGITWVDDAGQVAAPSGAMYQITVTNTGNIDLLTVTLEDTRSWDPDADLVLDFETPLLVGESRVIEGSTGTGVDIVWDVLDVAEVCDENTSGTFRNVAEATATWDDPSTGTVADDDFALMECLGPSISLRKEVCLADCEIEANWHDANDAPFPQAVYDLVNAAPAQYRLIVSNDGEVDLEDVYVTDTKRFPGQYSIGDLATGASVTVDSGDIPTLSVADICDSIGPETNIASVSGDSVLGGTYTAEDPATVNCVGNPSIEIIKEVSTDGVNFYEAVSALVYSDAYYRITVTNTGSEKLTDVNVDDDDWGVHQYVGDLDVGESVVLVHALTGGGLGQILVEDLYEQDFCDDDFDFENTAVATGDSDIGKKSVSAKDTADYSCITSQYVCGEGGTNTTPPDRIHIAYNGTAASNNHQGINVLPDDINLPQSGMTIKIYEHHKLEPQYLIHTYTGISVGTGKQMLIDGRSSSGKIPPNIGVQIIFDDQILQAFSFHGSCSAPLYIGDQFGGITLTSAEYD